MRHTEAAAFAGGFGAQTTLCDKVSSVTSLPRCVVILFVSFDLFVPLVLRC